MSPIRSPSTGPTSACRSFQRTAMPLGHASGPRLWATPGVRAEASSPAPTASTTRACGVLHARGHKSTAKRRVCAALPVRASHGHRLPRGRDPRPVCARSFDSGSRRRWGVWPPVREMPGRGTCGGLRPEFSSALSHLTGLLTAGVTFLSSV